MNTDVTTHGSPLAVFNDAVVFLNEEGSSPVDAAQATLFDGWVLVKRPRGGTDVYPRDRVRRISSGAVYASSRAEE